ncbi:glycosyltransferase [Listeria monocytogenes]|nr:glycosyltransferase [Listeria monocytogenes]OFF49921.1 glycosyltransferase [Listeria monocytogenes]OFG14994.1 glycosyltransferase [Listeria monocytogenes]
MIGGITLKQCLVCENYTIEANYDICEVCYWEYDVVAQEYPDEIIGANNISLKQAKINYAKFCAVEEKYITLVRKPRQDELPK